VFWSNDVEKCVEKLTAQEAQNRLSSFSNWASIIHSELWPEVVIGIELKKDGILTSDRPPLFISGRSHHFLFDEWHSSGFESNAQIP
jgi:hypothetical protein